jgi:hypothetical protein
MMIVQGRSNFDGFMQKLLGNLWSAVPSWERISLSRPESTVVSSRARLRTSMLPLMSPDESKRNWEGAGRLECMPWTMH